LALLFGEERYAEAATKTLAAIAPLAERYPSASAFSSASRMARRAAEGGCDYGTAR